jgi:hypothetical protein
MAPLGMPSGHPEQASHGLLRTWDEARAQGAAACLHVVDDRASLGFRALRLAYGPAASRRACRAPGATMQEAEAVAPRALAPGELGLARAPAKWAGSLDPGARGKVGALPGGLLEPRWSLAQDLQTPRRRWSPSGRGSQDTTQLRSVTTGVLLGISATRTLVALPLITAETLIVP